MSTTLQIKFDNNDIIKINYDKDTLFDNCDDHTKVFIKSTINKFINSTQSNHPLKMTAHNLFCTGLMAYLTDDELDMIYYFTKSIDKGNSDAMFFLAKYYYNKNTDHDFSLKYFLMAHENNNIFAAFYIGRTYKRKKEYVLMEKYYFIGIKNFDHRAMNALGFYYDELEQFDKAIKYYLMAIKYGSVSASNNLGYYYMDHKQFDKGLKYYLMAIKKGDTQSMANLGLDYKKKGNYDLMKKYYLMGVIKYCKKCISKSIYYTNQYNDIDFILTILPYLSKSQKYGLNMKFRKKIKFNGITKECYICLEDEKHVTLSCHKAHSICYKCYYQIEDTCPACRKKLIY